MPHPLPRAHRHGSRGCRLTLPRPTNAGTGERLTRPSPVRVTRWRHETAPNPARVGEYVDRAGTLHGFLRERDGSVTTIDAPGASATAAYDIDDHGRIAGAYADAGLVVRGFVREPDGEFTTIDVPDAAPAGAADTAASGINNQGQIVGSYSDAAGVQHGFVLDDGMFTTVDAPDAPGDTGVTDIDDGGRLVGVYGLVKYDYLLDERGKFSALDVPGVVSQPFPRASTTRARSSATPTRTGLGASTASRATSGAGTGGSTSPAGRERRRPGSMTTGRSSVSTATAATPRICAASWSTAGNSHGSTCPAPS
jgi:probable HAF family extracellular repeat protein